MIYRGNLNEYISNIILKECNNEFIPISIEINNSNSLLETEDMQQEISNESLSITETKSSIANDETDYKTIILNLRDEIDVLKSQLNEMKLKQDRFEFDLKLCNELNSKHVKAQQKKILFLMKRLLDIEKEEEQIDSDFDDDNKIISNKDNIFRF